MKVLVCLRLLSLAILLTPTNCEEIIVSTAGFDVAGDGTLDRPYRTIQWAIENAFDQDIITVRDGVHSGEGNIKIDFMQKRLTIRSQNGLLKTTINCQGSGPAMWFSSGDDVSVDGFTFVNCTNNNGGALSISNSDPRFSNLDLSYCRARSGGAVYIGANSSPRFFQTKMHYNEALYGGAVVASVNAKPAFESTTLIHNRATKGGAVFLHGDTVTFFASVTLEHNQADHGGAVAADQHARATFESCKCRYNQGLDQGGGVWATDTAYLGLINSQLNNNTSAKGGGAACVEHGVISLFNSLVFGNVGSQWGGGLAQHGGCTLTLEGSALSANFGTMGPMVYPWDLMQTLADPRFGNSVCSANGAPSPDGWDSCVCFAGYVHEDCSHKCPGTPMCSSHGFCVDETNGAMCMCDSGYFGSNCSLTCPGLVGSKVCSGHGDCVLLDGSPTCMCHIGYSSATCSLNTVVIAISTGRLTERYVELRKSSGLALSPSQAVLYLQDKLAGIDLLVLQQNDLTISFHELYGVLGTGGAQAVIDAAEARRMALDIIRLTRPPFPDFYFVVSTFGDTWMDGLSAELGSALKRIGAQDLSQFIGFGAQLQFLLFGATGMSENDAVQRLDFNAVLNVRLEYFDPIYKVVVA